MAGTLFTAFALTLLVFFAAVLLAALRRALGLGKLLKPFFPLLLLFFRRFVLLFAHGSSDRLPQSYQFKLNLNKI
jgi:hypothetical protein